MYIILTFQVIYKAERRKQQIAPNTVIQKLLVFKFDDNSTNQSLNRPLSVLTYKQEDGQIDRGKERKERRKEGGRMDGGKINDGWMIGQTKRKLEKQMNGWTY